VKTWVKVVIAVVVLGVLLVVVLIAGGAYLVSRHFQIAGDVDEARAVDEFNEVRARFAGQEPLVTIDGDRLTVVELERRMATYTGPTPQTLRVLVWSEDENKLVRLVIPFWVLRLSRDQPMNLDIDGMERIRVTPAELDRAGPALVLDHRDRKDRLLMWTE
jgi:hypothetical protein